LFFPWKPPLELHHSVIPLSDQSFLRTKDAEPSDYLFLKDVEVNVDDGCNVESH